MKALAAAISARARRHRAEILRSHIQIQPDWRILDLGGGTGRHIKSVFPDHQNIVVCDHAAEDLAVARSLGYQTVQADGSDRLPFKDGEFDLVFCSSVLEHVTGPKETVGTIRSDDAFRALAWKHQRVFAQEIARIAKRYYVQTPHRYFLVESHSWLPGVIVLLPRSLLISTLDQTNRFWFKKTYPDWNLLVPRQMRELFPEAEIVVEKSFGLPKSIMAFKS